MEHYINKIRQSCGRLNEIYPGYTHTVFDPKTQDEVTAVFSRFDLEEALLDLNELYSCCDGIEFPVAINGLQIRRIESIAQDYWRIPKLITANNAKVFTFASNGGGHFFSIDLMTCEVYFLPSSKIGREGQYEGEGINVVAVNMWDFVLKLSKDVEAEALQDETHEYNLP